MNPSEKLDFLVALSDRIGLEVRVEAMGGDGGGLCAMRNHCVLFIDLEADETTRYESTLQAMSELPILSDVYLPPAVREDLHRLTADASGSEFEA